ncbi:hypothetical protein M8C21_004522, partial [Ambrosia artemisiifolia]
MDAGISSIVTPVVESLMVPVKKHLGFLVSSTKHVKVMTEEMDQLNLTEQDIHDKKNTADLNFLEISRHVSPWLEDVAEMKEKVKSIPTTGIGCFNVAKRYKAGKQSCVLVEQIKALKKRASEISWTNERKSLAKVASTSAAAPHGTQTTFESRESVFNAALQSLQSNDESQKMIALCGMGGVGKTTMMEQLKKAVENSKMFDWVVKVVVGESTDLFALQQAVAEYIKEGLTEKTKEVRAELLRKKFEEMSKKGQKKILVIMDDLWKEVDLEDVGLTSPLPNGFKLLFTSRFEGVCTKMGVTPNSIFRVGVLNEAEAKTLFFEIARPTPSDADDEFQKIGEDIVNKCGGLPIALKTIAKSLIGNVKEAWNETLSNLQRDDLQNLNDIVHKVFEMSYNNLQMEDDKSVFLLSGLFPDDFNIPIEDLLRYGWGLKLFTNVHTLREARRRTIVCVNNLIRANLLIESECMGCVKMHDLVRAFALSISEIPLDFNYPNLSLLIMMDGNNLHKFPQHVYEKSDNLEVASYEKMGIPLLPTMFEHSTKLRTLCFRSCSLIDDISFLGSLSNLEALSIVDCGIRRLPSMIGMLKKLKLLDLTGCVALRIDDGVFKNLVSLEELYMRAVKYQPIRFTDANCEELEILSQRLFALELEFFENKAQLQKVSFEKIERFRISIGCRLVELEDDKKYSFKNTIKFYGDCNELLEINELFEKTEELYVSGCKELTYLFTVAMVSSLKKLERLEVSECPVMRTLVDEDCTVGVIRFPKLNLMYLRDLQNMVSLCRTVIQFPELVELSLSFLPNFTSIYPDSSNPGGIQSLLNKEVVIPKLEKLEIYDMKKLKQIWPCQIPTVEKNNVSMLRKIVVSNCDSLTNIFPDNPLPMLNNLEELEVEDCGSIEVIFNIDFETVSEMEGYVSRLRSINVEFLSNLRELWRMRGVNNSNILINGFQGVQSITISYCRRFKDIFTPVTNNFNLGALINYSANEWNVKSEVDEYKSEVDEYTCHHLQHLELFKDERVEVVFDMDSSPSSRQLTTIQPQLLPYLYLEGIYLHGLEEMSHVWKCCNWNKFLIPQHQPLQFPFQNLTYIILYECHKIKYLFSPLMAKYLSNLKKVEIYGCNGIEEVISRRDDEDGENTTSTSTYPDTTLFPHLDSLYIQSLPNLKSVDDGDTRCRSDKLSSNITSTIHDEFQSCQVIGASWSLCQYPREIWIRSCDALSCVIPWYAVGQMKRLHELVIAKCSSMTEVFECESINNVDEGGAPLRNVTVVVVPQLNNLKSLSISECDRLPHIFTFSTLGTLHHLKELKVNSCQAMQVIVKQENGTSSDCVVLPRLETLELDDLPNLKAFFLGMNDFRWPSLDNVLIEDCPELMMFTSGQSTTPKLKYIQTRFGKYSSECGLNFHRTISQTTLPPSSDPTISKGMPCSFHNLIEINIEWKGVGRTIIPSHALLQLQKLQQIHLTRCERAEEVFEVVGLEGTNGRGLNASQTAVHIPNLTQVELEGLDDLNLVQLKDLIISDCKNIEVIVKEVEEEECDAKVNEIMLPHLNSLKLEDLPRLKGFCLGHVSTPEL